MSGQNMGWKLAEDDRNALLGRFPPRYDAVIAHHVTYGEIDNADELPGHTSGRVVGHADDGEGVETLVVELGGSTERPTGGTYHITWSLADGRAPVESNDVIAACGWDEFADGPAFALKPPTRL